MLLAKYIYHNERRTSNKGQCFLVFIYIKYPEFTNQRIFDSEIVQKEMWRSRNVFLPEQPHLVAAQDILMKYFINFYKNSKN
jgi:hypothetical protein